MPKEKPVTERVFTNAELIEIEVARCEKDPVYFIKKYVYIQADEGRSLFQLYDFQEKIANLFNNPKYNRYSILKSRQIGITTLCAAYALWFILFKADMSVMSLAPTQKKAKIIVDKVKFAYDELPGWMLKRFPFENKNELSLILKNGSKVEAASGNSEAARGFTAHILFLDEAAFIENAEKLWGSAQQTLTTTKGKAIILSTPNGVGGWFYKKHTEAEEEILKIDASESQIGKFQPIRLPWQVHPNRDQAWRDEQTEEHGERLAKQECDCDFATSGDTVISPEVIEYYEKTHQKDPIEVRGVNKDEWIFAYPVPGRDYVAICDVGRGDGADASTMQIIDLVTNEQVYEYEGHLGTTEFANLIISRAYEYNEALLIIERESIGWASVQQAVECGYRNLYYSPKEGMVMDAETYMKRNYDYDTAKMVPGFSTNVKFRPLVINSFIMMIEKKALIIHSKRTINQFRTFIWFPDGKARAQKGSFDDLIIPIGIYGFLRDTAIRFSKTAQDLSKTTLDHFLVARTPTSRVRQGEPVAGNDPRPDGKPPVMPKVDPWKMQLNGRMIDISWLV